jgi:hypothetical protein
MRFNAATMMKTDPWSVPPIGTNEGFTVLAVIRSALPQNAGIASWWSEWGDGVWANLRSTGGPTPLTLLDYHRLDDGTLTQMYAGHQDLGTVGHVVAWRFSPSTETATLMVDGVLAPSRHQPPVGNITAMPLYVGAMSPLPTGLFQGDISELVIVGDEISDQQMQYFNEYARETWNLSPSPAGGPCIKADGQPSPDTIRCDDGNPETFGDHCSAGSCIGSVPGPGSPKDLSPVAWYHAGASEVVITWDGVSTWFDRSSEQRDLLNGYWGRPDLVADGWSPNKPTVRFDGANALKRNGWAGVPSGTESAFTVLAVLRPAPLQGSQSSQKSGVVSWWHSNAYGRVACQIAPSGEARALDLFRQDGFLASQEGIGNIDTGPAPHVVAWRYENGTAKLTVDGATQTQQHAPIGAIPPDWFLMGAASGYPTGLFSGDISELAVIPRSISDAELARFNDYALAEWGGLTLCTPGTPGCVGPVTPTVTCVANDAGTLYAVFGYENASAGPVTILAGPANQTTPTGSMRLPNVFQPGIHPQVVSVPLSGGSATWTISGVTAVATAGSPSCGALGPGEPPDPNGDTEKIDPPTDGFPVAPGGTYVEASSSGAPLVQVPVVPSVPFTGEEDDPTLALTHGERGDRSVEVVIVNDTDVTIFFKTGLAEGAITTQPPEFIRPGSYGTFETRDDGWMQGTGGFLEYFIGSGPEPRPVLSVDWDNPFLGDNVYHTSVSPNIPSTPFTSHRAHGTGANALATVFFVLRRTSQPVNDCPPGSMQWIIDNLRTMEPPLNFGDQGPAGAFTPVKRSGLGLQAWGQTSCRVGRVIGTIKRRAWSTDGFYTIDVSLDEFEGALLTGTNKAIRIEVDPVDPRDSDGENPAHQAIQDAGGLQDGGVEIGRRIMFNGIVRIDHGHFLEVHPFEGFTDAPTCGSPDEPLFCHPVVRNVFTAQAVNGSDFVFMGRAENRACFLITVDGLLQPNTGGGVGSSFANADIDDTTGEWKLTVRAPGFTGLRAQARCVAASGLSEAFDWDGGPGGTPMPMVSAARGCYITRVGGNWDETTSRIWISEGNPTLLAGTSGTYGSARCMAISGTGAFNAYVLQQPPTPRIFMDPLDFGCFYTEIKGHFAELGGTVDMGIQTVGGVHRWTAGIDDGARGGVIVCDSLTP